MKYDKFLKPGWRKIVLTCIFISLSFFYVYKPLIVDAYEEYRGLPLFYWKYFVGTGPIISGMKLPEPVTEFLYLNLIIDIVFWYIISCFIVWVYDKKLRKVSRK